jgi:glucosyl-dolichyl phosphate glucuronosyltransferase
MRVTVLICTYNRAVYLRKMLESIVASVVPDSVSWEVLIVDNNSSDQTPQVAEEFAARFPGRFRYIFEPKQGKSNALNSGVRSSGGDVIAFADDDVKVEPTWLWNLTKPLEDNTWAGVGGRTLMAEAFSPPRWLLLSGTHNLAGILAAVFDFGEEPRELDWAPYGANMAYRRSMFEKYGMFRSDLGPSADRRIPRPNEDTEFGRRLMAAGEHIRYEPLALVYHPVIRERIRKDYFLNWYFDFGRATVREVKRRPDILGIQRRYWTIAKIGTVKLMPQALRWMLNPHPAKRFFRKCIVRKFAGQIVEVYRLWGPIETKSNGAQKGIEGVVGSK